MIMGGKRQSRKRVAGAPVGSTPPLGDLEKGASLGSALDEIGFRALGKRILVSQRQPTFKARMTAGIRKPKNPIPDCSSSSNPPDGPRGSTDVPSADQT